MGVREAVAMQERRTGCLKYHWMLPASVLLVAAMSTVVCGLVMWETNLHNCSEDGSIPISSALLQRQSTLKACIVVLTALSWISACLVCQTTKSIEQTFYKLRSRDKDGNPIMVTPRDTESGGYTFWGTGNNTAEEPFVSTVPSPFDLTPESESRFLRDAAEFDAQQMAEYDAKISEGRLLGEQQMKLFADEDKLATACGELHRMILTAMSNGTERSAGWKHRETSKQGIVTTECADYAGTGITAFCSVGDVVGLSQQQLVALMTSANMDIRRQWDTNCATAELLESGPISPELGDYWCAHNAQHPYLGGMVGARDFLSVNCKWIDNAGAHFVVSRSIPNHPRVKVNKKLIRSTIHACGFRFQLAPDQSNSQTPTVRITYITCIDLKMSRLLRRPIENGMVSEAKRLFEVWRELGSRPDKLML